MLRYPYLTDVVGPYATINWATDGSGATGSVQWGRVGAESCTANTTGATRVAAFPVNSVYDYQWKAQLTLIPGVQYCYRVFLGGTDLLGSDPSPVFFTQVPAGSSEPFTFAVIGDWGSVDGNGNNPDQANLLAQLAASGARFALTTGDNVYPSGSQTNYGDLVQTGSSVSAMFGPQFWARVGASMPLFPAIGNHGFNRSDANHPHFLNWPQDRAVATSGGRYQKDTYCCVNGTTSAIYPSAWYAFDAGVARFYVLQDAWADGNVGTADVYANDYASQWTPDRAQYQWLANDLATHPGGIKFAFFHYPPYSDNKHESADTYLQGLDSLEGLLSQNGVNIAFNGHAHMYQRNAALQPPLLVTVLTGGGGATLERVDAGCSAYNAYGLGWSYSGNNGLGKGYACGSAQAPTSIGQVFHFMLVTVDGANVTVRGVNSLGETFDQLSYTFDVGSPTPTATATATPTNTPTNTPLPPTNTPTNTPLPPTNTPTNTPVPPTNTPTNTPVPPTNTPTNTPVPPTNTPTNTPVPPTNTPTNTPLPPTNTPTNTPLPPTSTPTATPTATATPSNTGFKAPAANAAVTTSSGDNNGFQTTPGNAYASDNVYAVDTNSGTTTSSNYTDSGKDRHQFYNYTFGLPSGATILGITVQLKAKVDSTSGSPKMYVELSPDGGATWSTAKSTATLATTDTVYTLGGVSDLWGRTWTDTQLSNANFRVRITNVATNTSRDFSLDQIAVQVTYR